MKVVLDIKTHPHIPDKLQLFIKNDIPITGFQFNIVGSIIEENVVLKDSHRKILKIMTGSGGQVIGYNRYGRYWDITYRGKVLIAELPMKGAPKLQEIPTFCVKNLIVVDLNGNRINDVVGNCYVNKEITSLPLPGDVNLDGQINITDIVHLVQNILGWVELEGQSFENADVNDDGLVNISDVVGIVNIILDSSDISMKSDEVNDLVKKIVSRAIKENLIISGGRK